MPIDPEALRRYAARLQDFVLNEYGWIAPKPPSGASAFDQLNQQRQFSPTERQFDAKDPREHLDATRTVPDRPGSPDHNDRRPPPAPQSEVFAGLCKPGGRLAVFATVGMGKTHLLHAFGLDLARNILSAKPDEIDQLPVPLLVKLPHWPGAPDSDGARRDTLLGMIQKCQADAWGRPAPLTPDMLEALLDDPRTVLLLDSLDEVPADHRPGVISAVDSLARSFKGALAITSRPNCGAEGLFPSDRQKTLEPLTSEQIADYIAAYRAAFGGPEFDPDTLPHEVAARIDQPLTLVQCCLFVAEEGRSPRSAAELMQNTLSAYIHRRPSLKKLHETARDRLLEVLPELAFPFAKAGFSALRATGVIPQVATRLQLPEPETERQLIETGLLHATDDGGVFMLKQPAVEYLVGKHLADTASLESSKGGSAPCPLLQVFPRWVWVPEMHDILSYTFEMLYGHADAQKRESADQWIDWLLNTARHDPSMANPAGKTGAHDDLTRPFAALALRLLRVGWRDERLPNAAELLATAVMRAQQFGHGADAATRWVPRVGGNALPFLRALIGRVPVEADVPENDPRGVIVRETASVVPSQGARTLVQVLLARLRQAANKDIRDALASAVRSAACRVPEKEARGYVTELLGELRKDENKDIRDVLAWAVEPAAGRVPEKEARGCVTELLGELRKDENKDIRDALAWAVRYAAGRVPEKEARGCVTELLGELRKDENKDIRGALTVAVESSAGRVAEKEARGYVTELLGELRKDENKGIRYALAWAVGSPAGRVAEKEARGCVTELLGELRKDENKGIRGALASAVGSAAGRVARADAADALREWLQRWMDEPEGSAARDALNVALWAVADRVDDADAYNLCVWLRESGQTHLPFRVAINSATVALLAVPPASEGEGCGLEVEWRNTKTFVLSTHEAVCPVAIRKALGLVADVWYDGEDLLAIADAIQKKQGTRGKPAADILRAMVYIQAKERESLTPEEEVDAESRGDNAWLRKTVNEAGGLRDMLVSWAKQTDAPLRLDSTTVLEYPYDNTTDIKTGTAFKEIAAVLHSKTLRLGRTARERLNALLDSFGEETCQFEKSDVGKEQLPARATPRSGARRKEL